MVNVTGDANEPVPSFMNTATLCSFELVKVTSTLPSPLTSVVASEMCWPCHAVPPVEYAVGPEKETRAVVQVDEELVAAEAYVAFEKIELAVAVDVRRGNLCRVVRNQGPWSERAVAVAEEEDGPASLAGCHGEVRLVVAVEICDDGVAG